MMEIRAVTSFLRTQLFDFCKGSHSILTADYSKTDIDTLARSEIASGMAVFLVGLGLILLIYHI